eukprot:TRINITY_DN9573_c0_g1::TRINITY_DN9573_c0_g1_i1::g.12197::m.12197 TRINITY_DN9573_c0_g1::TRINITY_DN9573_c0_g1_i1::g.12197  ORF type:complete len:280 (-),score=70.06,sp/Q5M8U1/ELOV5_XENTR/33.10/3e-33,ELO/PF01151.13/2.9e-57 TRINITY_DN9573_c0_g1_i1:165-1004(-)
MSAFIQRVQDDLLEAYTLGQAQVAERVKLGLQPHFPLADWTSLLTLCTAYLIITFVLYQIMQRKKEPFSLKPVIAVYNIMCVILAGTSLYGTVKYKLNRGGGFMCNETNPIIHSEDMEVAWYIWLFYIQKFFEFMDTWFFILRKSFRQVTFLHVYHHASIAIVVGGLFSTDWAGDIYLPVMLNSFVHVLMYTHYFLTSIGVKSWWRQHLTSMQLTQFLLIMFQSYYPLFFVNKEDCPGLATTRYALGTYMITMLVLFGNFFYQSYIVKPKAGEVQKKKQ